MSSKCRHGLPVAQCSTCVSHAGAGGESRSARDLLSSLAGRTIHTLTGRPNRILRLAGEDVFVATVKSPQGSPVPISWVQEALDRLYSEGEIPINVESVGYRSAFIGAVLLQVPGAIRPMVELSWPGDHRRKTKGLADR